MKKIVLYVLFIVIALMLNAQSISVTPVPGFGQYNRFNIAQIDPDQPFSQPVIFSWDINRDQASGTDSLPFTLKVKLTWNNLTLLDYELTAKEDFWTQNEERVTNRDVLTSIDSRKFYVGAEMISIDNLFDAAPALEDVVLNTGLLPDGVYSLSIQANSPVTIPSLSNKASINFEVKNANAIFLNQPGAEMGGAIPQLHNNIVVFNWQSNLVGLTEYKLTIKEFERKDDMIGRDLERVGREFMVIDALISSVYSGFLPFTDGYYYAWKVSAPIYSESTDYNPDIETQSSSLSVQSEYKVFHFVEDTSSTSNQITLEIAELLRQFGDNGVNSLLDGGNVPTTNVITEESWLSGEKAVKKIKEFIGKSVTIKITEQ